MPSRPRSRLAIRASRRLAAVAIALFAGADGPALAQPATGAANAVFDAVSKSVVSVHVFEAKPGARKRVALGSAVAIAPGRVVTNCHVLASGIAADTKARDLAIEVKVAGQRSTHKARLANADPTRDLCVLPACRFSRRAEQRLIPARLRGS
jgi:S1-C subfamily serine protease